MATKKDYIKFVSLLVVLTRTDAIKWTQSYVGDKLVFETEYRDKNLCVYGTNRPSNSTTALDITDDNGDSLWTFPVDVPDLMRAVKSKFVDIDNFISEALSEAGYS